MPKDRTPATSTTSSRGVQLKHLTWEDGHWITSDPRPLWASFYELPNIDKKYRLRQSLSVDLNLMDVFDNDEDAEEMQNITSSILKKIETCELDYLYLGNQNITYAEYLKLTKTKRIEELILKYVNIRYGDNGTMVPLEKVLAAVPRIHKMVIKGDISGESKFTVETARKIFELPRLKKLAYFGLHDIPTVFNVDDFCKFVEKYKNVAFHLHLADSVDDVYKKKFYTAMNAITEKNNDKVFIRLNGREHPFES